MKHIKGVKTCYLYSMASRLVNVRLDEEHVRKARLLRNHGVVLSEVIREAIDERYQQLQRSRNSLDVSKIVHDIFERYPDPPDLPPRTYDVRNRKAAREGIVRKLLRERA